VSLLGAIPVRDQPISESQTGSSISRRLIAVEHASGEGSFDMANDLPLELFFVREATRLELLPCCALRLGDRGWIGRCWLALIPQKEECALTLDNLDITSPKPRKGTLMLRASDAGGTYRAPEVRDGGTGRGTALSRSLSLNGRVVRGHCNRTVSSSSRRLFLAIVIVIVNNRRMGMRMRMRKAEMLEGTEGLVVVHDGE
jgi:hypothetical protein